MIVYREQQKATKCTNTFLPCPAEFEKKFITNKWRGESKTMNTL